MKNLMHVAAIAGALVLLPSALGAQMDPNLPPPNGPQGVVPSTGSQPVAATSMRDTLGAPGLTGQQMLDKEFMRAAVEAGIAEVNLGMLAAQKGGPDVKEFGQKMADDHTAINKDMATVADSLSVLLPKKMNKDDQAEYDRLKGLSGKDFDAEYIIFTAKAHWKDLHNFHMEASVAADPGLAAEAVKAAMMMHQHLVAVTKLAADEGVVLPPRPPRPSAPPPVAPSAAPSGH
jgi:putative membrane protein